MKIVDLSRQESITVHDVENAIASGATEIRVHPAGDIPPAARALLAQHGAVVRYVAAARRSEDARRDSGFFAEESVSLKREICSVGRKLWQRGYVDGNAGNISCRIGDREVLCTPTLLSKADLTPEALCLVNFEGKQIAGALPHTSEIHLHLEIYRNVPHAGAVVHCHPPHATAYAVAGSVPPTGIVPEYDIFVGGVALAPYETPGTRAFAETVRPYVRHHNTILLGNHGLVCWADTPTRAEWLVENIETYCRILLVCGQLGLSCRRIPSDKEKELQAIKGKLGLCSTEYHAKSFQE